MKAGHDTAFTPREQPPPDHKTFTALSHAVHPGRLALFRQHTERKEESAMQEIVHSYTRATPHPDQGYIRLLEEIAYLEARLIAIGHTGDCAYEKSLARSYTELLRARRRQLAAI
jgi:hypothetical protein